MSKSLNTVVYKYNQYSMCGVSVASYQLKAYFAAKFEGVQAG